MKADTGRFQDGGPNMRERDVEVLLKRETEKLGCLCMKFVSPGTAGVPDRIVLVPGGTAFFVELKAPGKTERPLQRYVQERLRGQGFAVFSSVDSRERVMDVCEYIRDLREKASKA